MTVAVEPNPRAAGLLAGRAHKGCVVQGIRCCPRSYALPLHLVLLFQFLFYFDSCRFCGQPPQISVSSQGFMVVDAISPALRSRLQRSLYRRFGLPAGLEPVASSPYSISFGILSSSMRATWPSQHSLLFASILNILGIPVY